MPRRRIVPALRLLAVLAVVATTVAIVGVRLPGKAAADTPFTFVNEQFNEANFPPTNWQAALGTWSASCQVVTAPMTGCAAVATVTDGTVGLNQLLFNPPAGIPANLKNLSLSFYSDFSPDATSTGDSVQGSSLSPGGYRRLRQSRHHRPCTRGGDATGARYSTPSASPTTERRSRSVGPPSATPRPPPARRGRSPT